jgi:quercetin dioxygenase-like cupin family protein
MNLIAVEDQLQLREKYIGPLTEYAGTKVLQLSLKEGSEIPSHQAKTNVLVIVQKGRVLFSCEKGQIELSPGRLLHILPSEPHSVLALEDTETYLIFS